MAVSKTSSVRLKAADRKQLALRLRRDGHSFAGIGQQLGCSAQRAHQIVTQGLAAINRENAELAAEVTRLEQERLDALLAAYMPAALDGHLQSAEFVLKIGDRRARLLGLDAASKVEGHFSFASLSDAELLAEARRLGIPVEPEKTDERDSVRADG